MTRSQARLLSAILLAVACHDGAPPPATAEELPQGTAPMYRCHPERAWRRVPLGAELRCARGGDLVCPLGNCRVEYRVVDSSRWEPDVNWREIGGRRRPVRLWPHQIYRVSAAGGALELRPAPP